ncbi:MAG: ISAzo13 family transposase, partial [Clostridia bacterium]|nr:ISAzo13 family transposase [Clostridia bacterium]
VGLSADTGAFAVNSIRSWWISMGKDRYPEADKLMITADGGGSNGRRNRLWKVSLQELANETGLSIYVSHFPPGTSKWNKIEHRLFSQISKNWRGRPLETIQIIVNLIASTTTKEGLTVQCTVDGNIYERGIKVSDDELKALNMMPNEWHAEWNYIIAPQRTPEA